MTMRAVSMLSSVTRAPRAHTVAGRSARAGCPRAPMAMRRMKLVASALPPRVAVVAAPAPGGAQEQTQQQLFSGLNGKALANIPPAEYPTMAEVMKAIPAHCFERNTLKSLGHAFLSTALVAACGVLAYMYIPLQAAYIPAWIAYAMVQGTLGTGCWVVAHECGHGAFSDNKLIQDTVGYILHSILLVPYFSWQRSHAVHHSRTNHIDEGETHVPMKAVAEDGQAIMKLKGALSEGPFAFVYLASILAFGWPVYLFTGASGGPVRGATNHFWPWAGATGKYALFPGKWAPKVLLSDLGVVATVAGLAAWAVAAGSAWPVVALYVGPYFFVNFWLVLYTWLQHTDVDVPHFGGDDWSQLKGALHTIDRPYGAVLDFLHHRIGSTHVAHHVSHTIPHYHALEATNALKAAFPQHYLYDPTPIHQALWRIGAKCTTVRQRATGEWLWA